MTTSEVSTIQRLTNLVPSTRESYSAWWYGRVIENKRDRSQPKIEVLFREVDCKGTPLERTLVRPVNIAMLGQVPLGSIWREGREIGDIPMDHRRFKVDFSPHGWDMLPSLHKNAPKHYLIPPYSHSILKGFNRSSADSWVIRFHLPNNSYLVVPSVVYYLRAYGLSSEIHRILITYPWQEAYKRLFGSNPQPDNTGTQTEKWTIQLGSRLQYSDAPFLAHVAYDPAVRKLAKGIWSQLLASPPEHPPHVRAAPWHCNIGEIEVLGKPLPGNGFLALRIVGLELPVSPPIEIIREQPRKAAILDTGYSEPAIPIAQHTATSQEMPIADYEPPDRGHGHIQIKEPEFLWLGNPPDVHTTPHLIEREHRRGTTVSNEAKQLSAGDASGSGKGTGKVVAHTPIVLESRGTLWDMWNILRKLQEQHPDNIQDVRCMQWDGRVLGIDETPVLCPIPTNAPKVRPHRWLYIDAESQQPRGILLILVKTNLGNAIIVEIQRRTAPDQPGKETESFQGLVVRVGESIEETLKWLKSIVSMASDRKGVFPKEALRSCPTLANKFKHKLSSNTMLRENTAWLALRKVGCVARITRQEKNNK